MLKPFENYRIHQLTKRKRTRLNLLEVYMKDYWKTNDVFYLDMATKYRKEIEEIEEKIQKIKGR